MKKDRWVRLQRASRPAPLTDAEVAAAARILDRSIDETRADLEREGNVTEYFVNDLYQVARRPVPGGMVQLNIRRRDGKPIFRDWRHFQRIKNELVGEECEGVELYPAESRKVDSSNKYHIWASPNPAFRFPIGWTERDVSDHGERSKAGYRQRPGSGSDDEPRAAGQTHALHAEFRRLFREAQDVALSHDEFLDLVFQAAVNLHTGAWQAPEQEIATCSTK